jgi:FAD:protein FMN transferase
MSELFNGRAPSRRDFLVLGAGIFAVSTLGLSVQRRRIVRRSVPVMGTIAEIAVVTRDERHAHAAITAALAELHAVERLMTRFNGISDIGRANAGAFSAPVPISAATAAVIAEGIRWASLAGSCFDPCIGRASELWDVSGRTEPPGPEAVRSLAGRSPYRGLELGRRAAGDVVVFNQPDIALDLGGIAKGYAVDRAVATLRDWGVTAALVNAGGDLYALGSSVDGEAWQVGIRSPDDPARLAGTLPLRDRAVATSGDYEQYFEHAGRRYHHLLDPATAAPRVASARSLTVAADTCMAADAAATAAYGLDAAAAGRLLAAARGGAELVARV